jgi:fluoride exporter
VACGSPTDSIQSPIPKHRDIFDRQEGERGMRTLIQYLAVAAAGSLGAVLRLVVARICGYFFITDFPVGTFIINITGSLFLGWFIAAATRSGMSDTMRLAIGVGFVGAYTTFSTFMHESNALIEKGEQFKAAANILGSLVVGLLAVRVGIWLAHK